MGDIDTLGPVGRVTHPDNDITANIVRMILFILIPFILQFPLCYITTKQADRKSRIKVYLDYINAARTTKSWPLRRDWIRLVTDAEGAGNWPIFYDRAPQFNVQNLLPYIKHHDAGTNM